MPPSEPAAAPTSEHPLSIAQIAGVLKTRIDSLGGVWAEGEITQWNERNANVFGKIKDVAAEATLSFAIWSSARRRLTDDFKQGDRVLAYFTPNFWPKGGSLTMVVSELRHVGLGDLLEKLERLKRQLASEGLFEPARKKALPFLPHLIGLITGANSDAEKDVLRNASLRWPAVRFRTIHTAVQGEHVPTEVVAAIHALDADPEVDVIIIARGGGDFQHLLGFSDESVVRTAAEAATPIVSAIGHENDRPILDEVADLRASTPTDAAKRVVPDVADELDLVHQISARLSQRITLLLRTETERLLQLRSRPVLAAPDWIIDSRAHEIQLSQDRLNERFGRSLESKLQHTTQRRAQLLALSPQATLNRGYAIVADADHRILTDASGTAAGDALHIQLSNGSLAATAGGPEPTSAASAQKGTE